MRLTFATLSLILALPALAQHADHSTHSTMPASPSAQAYEAANAKMHKDMDIKMSGDADRDFVEGMIPHHQGAVDMAKIVLQYGSDPQIKVMAQEIIAAQEKEIAQFRAWLAKRQK